MGHQVADGDVAVTLLELRKVAGNRIVDANLALLEQPHDGRRGGDYFGERSGIEDRVDGHRLARRNECALTVGFAIHHGAVVADEQHRAWDQAALNRLVELLVDGSRARERRLRPETHRGSEEREQFHCSFFAVSSSNFARSTSLLVIPWAE